MQNRGDYNHVELKLRNEAARYEGGSPNMIGLHALAASIDLLTSLGVGPQQSPIGERVIELTDVAVELLAAAGATICSPRVDNHKAGILVFDVPGVEPQVVRKRCEEAGIAVSCRGAGVRISPHAYNDEDELTRLATVVKELAG